jgi:hypothetical protein
MSSFFPCLEVDPPWLEPPKGTLVSWRKGRIVYEGRWVGVVVVLGDGVDLDGLWRGVVMSMVGL